MNKYGFPVSSEDFWHGWDLDITTEAMSAATHQQRDGKMYSGLPKHVMDEIAEKEQPAGLVWG